MPDARSIGLKRRFLRLPGRSVRVRPRPLGHPRAGDRRQVTVRRAQELRLPVAEHHPIPPGAVDSVELERLEHTAHPRDLARRERDQAGIAPHEARPVAVGDDLHDVPGEERAVPERNRPAPSKCRRDGSARPRPRRAGARPTGTRSAPTGGRRAPRPPRAAAHARRAGRPTRPSRSSSAGVRSRSCARHRSPVADRCRCRGVGRRRVLRDAGRTDIGVDTSLPRFRHAPRLGRCRCPFYQAGSRK
jgi:hypothetical protein